ncbi:MAG: cell wall-binding repeat-containing protein [Acidimicrobiaceae bacterium]|nr:cell wall-binding repeat-containing protein [Acidimicrobiaceae bacterium]
MSRRWLWAVLAAVLALPLWTLPHLAAGAAVIDVEFTRLAGPTRYSTSVQIAEAYMDRVDELPDESRVDTVILGSGLDRHAGWAVPVPMLSRLERAPLVFTRPDDVPVPVEQFLQRRDIRRVILLGGPAVISTAVERELGDLGVGTVERLGSDDIHSHAIEVATSFGLPAGEFGSKGRTALLTTSRVLADALAAGPMAYQGRYPILLTPPDSLHPAVFDFLVASDLDHVIIVGGTAAVGGAVQRALSGLDFTTARIAGNDRYGTAVELAETMLDRDDPLRPCFDGTELGLAYGGLSPDAIASGPLLGEQCALLLLTPSDTLPRTVASFLRSDDYVTGDADNALEVTVFGGTAVVPAEVVTQFFERATTLIPIGGRISVELDPVTETAHQFTVIFTSDIDSKKAARALEPDVRMFSVNSEPVRAASSELCAASPADPDEWCASVRVRGKSVTVTLDRDHRLLEAEDVIAVTGGQRIGTNNSPRPTARFSFVIPEPEEPADLDAPEVRIIAPAGHDRFAVLVIEEHPYEPAVLTPAEVAERIAVMAGDGTRKPLDLDPAPAGPSPGAAGTRAKHQRYVFALDGTTLEEGDAITVSRGVFLDEDGRASPRHLHVVAEPSVDFRIETVTVGDVDSTNQARVTLTASTQLDATPSGALTVTARSDGFASGGRGNDWRVYGVGLPETDDDSDAEDVDCSDPDEECITVLVNRTTRVIAYRILAGEPTFAELAEVLSDDRDFAANFVVEVVGADAAGGTIGGTVQAGLQLSGGGTAVGLRVRFGDPVAALLDAADPPAPLGADAVACTSIPLVADLVPKLIVARDGCRLHFDAPDQVIHMTLNAASVSRLPARGDLVFVSGAAARDYGGRTNIAQGWLSIRYDPSVPVD